MIEEHMRKRKWENSDVLQLISSQDLTKIPPRYHKILLDHADQVYMQLKISVW